MLDLFLEESANTPKVQFNNETNRLEIEGRLLPEHPGPFFEKLNDWLANVPEAGRDITISFYLYYYNTTSTKRLVMFLQEISKHISAGSNIAVEWRYDEEDEDAYDDGIDFQDASGIDIKLIAVEEEGE